jgi:hypothetical protein
MGLDMYASTVKAEIIGDRQTDFDPAALVCEHHGLTVGASLDEREEALALAQAAGDYKPEFSYWRKFNNLHGWMERLYHQKGGSEDVFNCTTVRLMPKDLDALEAEAKTLEPTSGFFFGSQDDMTQKDVDEVLDFVKKSRAAIEAGNAVVYDSWW